MGGKGRIGKIDNMQVGCNLKREGG